MFVNIVKKEMERKKVTQEVIALKMAEIAGERYTQSQISKMLKNDRKVNIIDSILLLEVLKLSANKVFNRKNIKSILEENRKRNEVKK